jgi:peptidoglycan/LPS O-acetylase OafA/YrhL
MNRGLSLYLDLLRFGAALAIVVTHLAYTELSSGMLQYWRLLGNDAVMVFFVLSGFVIAHVAHEKETTLRAYATSRLARLWSVAVPALALTILLDRWGQALDPAAYAQWWHQAGDPVWRAVRALTFTNELWFSSIRPFSNGPWWSLGYEAFYYAIFAALFYLGGWKRIAAAGGLMLLAGPKIMLLFPIWWLGVWTWKRTRCATLPVDKAALAFFGSIALYALFRWSGLPVLLRDATYFAMGPENAAHYLHFSDEFLSSYVIGPLVALNFLGAHGLSAALEKHLGPWRGPITWTAQSTFALYLLHYPLLRFAHAAFAYDVQDPLQIFAVFLGVVGTCVAIGPGIEKTKRIWKALLSLRLHRPAPARTSEPV